MRLTVSTILLAVVSSLASAQQSNADHLLNVAIEAQQREDFPAAIRAYRLLLQIQPNSVAAKVNLGAALVHERQYDAAILEYKGALSLAPRNHAILRNLALAYYKKGDLKNAREQFEVVHTALADDVGVVTLLGDIYLRMGEPSMAANLLTPYAATASMNQDFEFVYASALIGAGERRQGAIVMQKVAEAGNSDNSYMIAGETWLVLNEFELARNDLETALRLNPKLPGISSKVGTARDKTGDVAGAESAFREALKVNPDDFTANLYLGAIFYKRRELDQAKVYLQRALHADPKSAMAIYEVAMLKSASGEYEAAAQDLQRLVQSDPNWLEPHVELATLYYRLHRPEDGVKQRQIVERLTAEQQIKGPGK